MQARAGLESTSRVWRAAALLVLTAGLGLSVPLVKPGDAVMLVLAGLVLGGLGTLLVELVAGSGARGAAALWRAALVTAAWSGLSLLALMGLSAVSGWGAATLAVLLAVTSPPALRVVRTVVPWMDQDVAGDVSAMTSAELCSAWRRTFDWLRDAQHPATVVDLAARRQALLDELERRHPDGVQAWLTSVPVPGSDPQGFLQLPPAA